ncbi:MAG: hypothetical protein ACI8TX_002964 [Hyphomicrobiaceae bacterium]
MTLFPGLCARFGHQPTHLFAEPLLPLIQSCLARGAFLSGTSYRWVTSGRYRYCFYGGRYYYPYMYGGKTVYIQVNVSSSNPTPPSSTQVIVIVIVNVN